MSDNKEARKFAKRLRGIGLDVVEREGRYVIRRPDSDETLGSFSHSINMSTMKNITAQVRRAGYKL